MSNPGCELRKLPLRQRKFLKAYLETGNALKSSQIAGYNEVSGYEILKNPQFQFAFQAYLEKSGLDDNRIQSKLNELLEAKKVQNCNIVLKRDKEGKLTVQDTDDFIEVPDNRAQVKALELAVKLKGHLRENQINIDTGDKTIVYVRPGSERVDVTPGKGMLRRGRNGKQGGQVIAGVAPVERVALTTPTEQSSPVVRNPGEDLSGTPTEKR